MIQVVSVVGSLLILAAYTANQAGRITADRLSYIVGNAVGSAILSVVAIHEEQWGFLVLEGVWTIVSLWALVKKWPGSSTA